MTVTQSLGGDFTVTTDDGALLRIATRTQTPAPARLEVMYNSRLPQSRRP